MIEGLLANLFQKGIDFGATPLCGGRLLSIASAGRLKELSLRADNFFTVFTVSARERLADHEERVFVLVPGGSRHIVNVREGREAEPEWGAACHYRFLENMCSE